MENSEKLQIELDREKLKNRMWASVFLGYLGIESLITKKSLFGETVLLEYPFINYILYSAAFICIFTSCFNILSYVFKRKNR